MADLSSDQKDEFKLSFKPSSITMNTNTNNGSQQWMQSSLTNNFANQQFMQSHSPSSILLSGFNDTHISNNNHSSNNLFNSDTNNTNTRNNNPMLNVSSLSALPTDSEIIFNESVPIIVKASMTDTNTRYLTLKIEKLVQLPQNQSILSITLTDESDPYFLYTLNVTENDFHHLKSDQTLLVDFAVFPKSLVMLLQQCLQCKASEHPKFVAVLVYANQNSKNYAILSVQETNQFRHLQHISLRLMSASADTLRKYLGQSLILYKLQCKKLNRNYSETKQSLQRAKLDKKKAEIYVSEIKQKYEQCLCDLKTSHSQQISALKQNNLETNEEKRKELIAQRNDLENELKLQIKTVMLKYDKMKDEFDGLNTNYVTLESKFKNQSEILRETKAQFEANKGELSELRVECKSLDQLKFKYEKQINEHSITISALKQQIKDKSEIADNNTSLLNAEREQKKSKQQQIAMYKTNLEKSEKKVKECIKEINKGNNIISHLQNEIRNQRNKNKIKEQKLQNMSEKYNNNNSDIDRLNANVNKKEELVSKYKGEIAELKHTLRACKDKLEESQKAIESNQRVISYLNKQLNDSHSNMFGHSPTNGSQLLAGMTPSPFGAKVMSNITNKYHNSNSPFLPSKMSGLSSVGISGLSQNSQSHSHSHTAVSPILNNNNTAVSPILNNNNTTAPSSYFPQ